MAQIQLLKSWNTVVVVLVDDGLASFWPGFVSELEADEFTPGSQSAHIRVVGGMVMVAPGSGGRSQIRRR